MSKYLINDSKCWIVEIYEDYLQKYVPIVSDNYSTRQQARRRMRQLREYAIDNSEEKNKFRVSQYVCCNPDTGW